MREEIFCKPVFKCIQDGRSRGSAAADVVIFAAILVFVILPVFSFILEKFLILNKAEIIKDAMDMTNLSVYNAINTGSLGEAHVDLENERIEEIYRSLLAENLKLDNCLKPSPGSLAEDTVVIESLLMLSDYFPDVCPGGTEITRPTIHSTVIVPIRPSLYRHIILSILGKQFVELEIHVDSDIPVNN